MKVVNVRRLGYFTRSKANRATNAGAVQTFTEFTSEFGFEPHGVNFYISIGPAGLKQLEKDGLYRNGTLVTALNATHKAFFSTVQSALQASSANEKYVMLGIEPKDTADPYGYVLQQEASLGWVTKLAKELHALQRGVPGKKLDIILRYASEMNDTGGPNVWSQRPPKEYVDSHRLVRDIFRQHAPNIRFAFSPALRKDINDAKIEAIKKYWPEKPGDTEKYVDVISCTWYSGTQAALPDAEKFMRKYFLQRKGKGLPFGFDELGGIDGTKDNDRILAQMLAYVDSLRLSDGITFEYATLFLAGKFGVDVKLGFLDG